MVNNFTQFFFHKFILINVFVSVKCAAPRLVIFLILPVIKYHGKQRNPGDILCFISDPNVEKFSEHFLPLHFKILDRASPWAWCAVKRKLEHQESNPGLSGYKPEALPLSYVPKLHMSDPWRFRWYASTCQPLRWRRTETIAQRHHTFDTIACCDSFVQGMMKSMGNYRSETQNPPSRAMAL